MRPQHGVCWMCWGVMIFAVALSPDGKDVATTSKDGTVKNWSPNSFTQRKPAEVLRQ